MENPSSVCGERSPHTPVKAVEIMKRTGAEDVSSTTEAKADYAASSIRNEV